MLLVSRVSKLYLLWLSSSQGFQTATQGCWPHRSVGSICVGFLRHKVSRQLLMAAGLTGQLALSVLAFFVTRFPDSYSWLLASSVSWLYLFWLSLSQGFQTITHGCWPHRSIGSICFGFLRRKVSRQLLMAVGLTGQLALSVLAFYVTRFPDSYSWLLASPVSWVYLFWLSSSQGFQRATHDCWPHRSVGSICFGFLCHKVSRQLLMAAGLTGQLALSVLAFLVTRFPDSYSWLLWWCVILELLWRCAILELLWRCAILELLWRCAMLELLWWCAILELLWWCAILELLWWCAMFELLRWCAILELLWWCAILELLWRYAILELL